MLRSQKTRPDVYRPVEERMYNHPKPNLDTSILRIHLLNQTIQLLGVHILPFLFLFCFGFFFFDKQLSPDRPYYLPFPQPSTAPSRWAWRTELSWTVRSPRHQNDEQRIVGPRTPGWTSAALTWDRARGLPGETIKNSGCRWTLGMKPGWQESTHRGKQPQATIAANIVSGWRNTLSPTAKTTSPSTHTNNTDKWRYSRQNSGFPEPALK